MRKAKCLEDYYHFASNKKKNQTNRPRYILQKKKSLNVLCLIFLFWREVIGDTAGGIVSVHLVAFSDLEKQEQSKKPSSLWKHGWEISPELWVKWNPCLEKEDGGVKTSSQCFSRQRKEFHPWLEGRRIPGEQNLVLMGQSSDRKDAFGYWQTKSLVVVELPGHLRWNSELIWKCSGITAKGSSCSHSGAAPRSEMPELL